MVESGAIAATQASRDETTLLLPLPDKPSIIALPFVNMSQDPEQEYFSNGITEDITVVRQILPLKDPAMLERVLVALRKAGLK